MPNIVRTHAVDIAKKLEKHKPKKSTDPRFEIKTKKGGKHLLVMIWYGGQWIGRYGIKHDQRPHLGHNWVPEQMSLSPKQTAEFAECTMSHEQYAEILIAKGVISAI